MMKPEAVELDVRDLLTEGRSPLPLILNTVGSLKPQQSLLLRASWEPAPLYEMLGQLGFSHRATQESEELWTVEFYKEPGQPRAPGHEPPCII